MQIVLFQCMSATKNVNQSLINSMLCRVAYTNMATGGKQHFQIPFFNKMAIILADDIFKCIFLN